MSDRYFAKVVKVVDKYTVVINAGADTGVRVGQNFLIVGIGEEIMDPDTNESLGPLEIVRGRARVLHVQGKISTLTSSDLEKQPDVKEIRKVSTGASNKASAFAGIFGPQETITESIKPSDPKIKSLAGVSTGDQVIQV